MKVQKQITGFVEFLREQSVVGLAIGFILGQAAKDLVNSFVEDIMEPILGLALGSTEGLDVAVIYIFGAEVQYGRFLSIGIDFLVVTAVIYFVFKGLRLDRLDKQKSS